MAAFPRHSRRQLCVFFAAQGFFRMPFRVYRALFLRPAVRPASDTDFTCWHAVSLIFSTDRRRFCKCDVDGRCGRSGATFCSRTVLEVCRLAFSPRRRTHVTSCSMCWHVLVEMRSQSITFVSVSSGKRSGSWVVWPRSEAHLIARCEYFVFTTVCAVFVVSANRVACRSSSATLHQFLRKIHGTWCRG